MSRLVKSYFFISLFMFMNVVLMFVFEMLLARRFGTSFEMDCYLAAITIPELVVAVAVGGFNYALIPSLVAQLEGENPDYAFHLMNTWLNIIFISFAVFSILTGFWSRPIVHLFFPGFSNAQTTFAAKLLCFYFPVMIFKIMTILLSSIYFARYRFTIAPLAPAIGAVSAVLFFLIFEPFLKMFSIPLALTLSTVLQFSILFGIYLKEGHYQFDFWLKHGLFIKHVKLMLPLLIGGLITKSNFLVDRTIASTLETGAISCLGYATKIMNVFLLIGIGGLSLASFPVISSVIAKRDYNRLREMNHRAFSTIFFITVSIYVVVFFYGNEFLSLLFQYGSFTAEDSRNVAHVLRFLGGFFVFGALGTFVSILFYAIPDTRTPTLVGIGGFVLGVGLKIILSSFLSYNGIALASSIYYGITVLTMILFLRRRPEPFIHFRRLLNEFIRTMVVGLLVFILVYAVNPALGEHPVKLLLKLLATIGMLLGLGFLLKLDAITFLPWKWFVPWKK